MLYTLMMAALPPTTAFQARYLAWVIGVVLIVLAVLGLLGVVPFDPKLFWGALLAVGVALFL